MFTFKTEKSTGKFRSFYNDNHIIKIKRGTVGRISDEHPHHIRLMVWKDDIKEDGNNNCPWKWITLKKQSASVLEAKEWLKLAYEPLMKKFRLYIIKD